MNYKELHQKLKQIVNLAHPDGDLEMLRLIEKDYREIREQAYNEVCGELAKTIEFAKRKKKTLLPI